MTPGGMYQECAIATHVLMALIVQLFAFVDGYKWLYALRLLNKSRKTGHDKPSPQMPRAATDVMRANLELENK